MARGWESKSVEEQQDAAARERAARQAPPLSEAEKARAQQREGLRLARAHTVATLQTACNPRHRAMLEETLAHLDAQLAALARRPREAPRPRRPHLSETARAVASPYGQVGRSGLEPSQTVF